MPTSSLHKNNRRKQSLTRPLPKETAAVSVLRAQCSASVYKRPANTGLLLVIRLAQALPYSATLARLSSYINIAGPSLIMHVDLPASYSNTKANFAWR